MVASTSRRRRGVVLLVVLSLLTLFAVVAVSFVYYSENQAQNAGLNLSAENTIRPEPDLLFGYALKQLVFDTNNPESALRAQSLLRNLYGGVGDTPFNGTGRRGDADPYFQDPAVVTALGLPPRFPAFPDSGTYPRYDVPKNALLNLQFRPELFHPITGLFNHDLYGTFNPGYTYPDRNHPYLGSIVADGSQHSTNMGTNVPNLLAGHFPGTNLVVARSFVREVQLPTPLTDRAPYDTIPNNPALLLRQGYNPRHYEYWTHPLYSPETREGLIQRSMIFRPHPADHLKPQFGYQVAGYPGPFSIEGFLASASPSKQLPSDWYGFPPPADLGGDVKNLPPNFRTLVYVTQGGSAVIPTFADNDSFWMDLGYPVQTDSKGKRYKPLFAMFVVDVDGRINVNVHGNVATAYLTAGGATLPIPISASNQGWGPHEVSVQRALFTPEWTQVFNGVGGVVGSYTTRDRGRNGGVAGADQPGSALLNDFVAFGPRGTVRAHGMLDFNARQGPGLANGQPMIMPPTPGPTNPVTLAPRPGFPGGFENGSVSPMSAALGLHERQRHGATYPLLSSNPALAQELDRIFGHSDLEALLRHGDTNADAIPSDLKRLAPQAFGASLNPDQAFRAAMRRNYVTTHSADLNTPSKFPFLPLPGTSQVRYPDPSPLPDPFAPRPNNFSNYPSSGPGGMWTQLNESPRGETVNFPSNLPGPQAGPPPVPVIREGEISNVPGERWRSIARELRLNLNRFLRPFPHLGVGADPDGMDYNNRFSGAVPPAAAVWPPHPEAIRYNTASAPQILQHNAALRDRQELARDIYRRLVHATVGYDFTSDPVLGWPRLAIPDPGAGAAPGQDPIFCAELRWRRWLAQLAANIVDFIDDDDVMTPFNFFTAEDALPGTAGFYNPAELANPADPPAQQVPLYWVFGTELPRVVVNEVMAEADVPTPPPAGNPATPFQVNTWVELFNTSRNTTKNAASLDRTAVVTDRGIVGADGASKLDNRDIPLYVPAAGGLTDYAPYRVIVARTDPRGGGPLALPNSGAIPDYSVNVTGAPNLILFQTTKRHFSTTTLNRIDGSAVAGAPQARIAANSFFLLGRQTDKRNTIRPNTNTTPTPGLVPGAPTVDALNPPTEQGVLTPFLHEANEGAAGGDGPFMQFNASVDDMGLWPNNDPERQYGVTVVLQRLLNPYLPPNDYYQGDYDPTTPPPNAVPGLPEFDPNLPYNPYITVDYLAETPVNDTRLADPNNTAAGNRTFSRGKRQPFASFITQVQGQDFYEGAGLGTVYPNFINAPPNMPTDNWTRHTLGSVNTQGVGAGAALQPFQWLIHLDRQLTSPMELLHVSGFKPHELTQRFIDNVIMYTSGNLAAGANTIPFINTNDFEAVMPPNAPAAFRNNFHVQMQVGDAVAIGVGTETEIHNIAPVPPPNNNFTIAGTLARAHNNGGAVRVMNLSRTLPFNHRAPWLDPYAKLVEPGQLSPSTILNQSSNRLMRFLEFVSCDDSFRSGNAHSVLFNRQAVAVGLREVTLDTVQGLAVGSPQPGDLTGSHANGQVWRVQVGSTLLVDPGQPTQEVVTVLAVNYATGQYAAVFRNAHAAGAVVLVDYAPPMVPIPATANINAAGLGIIQLPFPPPAVADPLPPAGALPPALNYYLATTANVEYHIAPGTRLLVDAGLPSEEYVTVLAHGPLAANALQHPALYGPTFPNHPALPTRNHVLAAFTAPHTAAPTFVHVAPGTGRTFGKVNINTINDVEVFRSLVDAQAANSINPIVGRWDGPGVPAPVTYQHDNGGFPAFPDPKNPNNVGNLTFTIPAGAGVTSPAAQIGDPPQPFIRGTTNGMTWTISAGAGLNGNTVLEFKEYDAGGGGRPAWCRIEHVRVRQIAGATNSGETGPFTIVCEPASQVNNSAQPRRLIPGMLPFEVSVDNVAAIFAEIQRSRDGVANALTQPPTHGKVTTTSPKPFAPWTFGQATEANPNDKQTGIYASLFRPSVLNPNQMALSVPGANHPHQAAELLTKIGANITNRSNVFAVWITVGYFEVVDIPERHPITGAPIVEFDSAGRRRLHRLGGEIGKLEGRNIRHRFFALVDRTVFDHWMQTQVKTNGGSVANWLLGNNDFDPRRDYRINPVGTTVPLGPPASVLYWSVIE